MEVIVAGMNVDIAGIELINKLFSTSDRDERNRLLLELERLEWTPETISASYARISRDPRPIQMLRDEARLEVEKARKSNEKIIFGMGHASIAEHAIFNFDIMGISRNAVEILQRARLASFTEKSQRYVEFDSCFCIPQELEGNNALQKRYDEICNLLYKEYQRFYNVLRPYFLEKQPSLKEGSRDYVTLENYAKEDARYLLPLATETQLGMTVNARSLEKMIRRLRAHGTIECRILADMLYEKVHTIAPSLVKYTSPSAYETETLPLLSQFIELEDDAKNGTIDEVVLLECENDLENKIFASILVHVKSVSYHGAYKEVTSWDNKRKKEFLSGTLHSINFYDAILRDFELSNFRFEIVISASAFAQLKRHRMASIISGPYSPQLDYTIPPSIQKVGLEDDFIKIMGEVNGFYSTLQTSLPNIADYVLTNAHRRRILFQCNLRELVHIARLRADIHAQWDIRQITNRMITEIKKQYPLFGVMLSSKDDFEKSLSLL